jgi:c-di-GMP-binding flagellar brake protein YcgR
MEISEKRQSKRIKVNLPISYEYLGSQKDFGETVSKDLSVTGLRMNMPSFFPPNSGFLIRLRFPEVQKIVEGIARIVWSHRISFSDQYQTGLQFYEMNPVSKKWLEEYILINETFAK